MKITIDTDKGYLTGEEVNTLFQIMYENKELIECLDDQYGKGSLVNDMFKDWTDYFNPTAMFVYPDDEEEEEEGC